MTLRTFAYFEFVDIGVEEEDEAEGHDPFTDCAGDVEGVVLGVGTLIRSSDHIHNWNYINEERGLKM